jgi:ubiquitin C-terminal hydrolase
MTPEPFFIINLPIPNSQTNKSPSLSDCFDLYVEGEILDGDNCVLNEATGIKEAARKNLTFWSLPTILVIDIKRYNVSNRKNQILVDFPLTDLNLSKYVIGYNKETYIYDLYGVCNHGGSVQGGHYTSYVKNANDKWYHYNDTSVTEVPEQIHKQQIVSPKAYCFFYRKRAIK